MRRWWCRQSQQLIAYAKQFRTRFDSVCTELDFLRSANTVAPTGQDETRKQIEMYDGDSNLFVEKSFLHPFRIRFNCPRRAGDEKDWLPGLWNGDPVPAISSKTNLSSETNSSWIEETIFRSKHWVPAHLVIAVTANLSSSLGRYAKRSKSMEQMARQSDKHFCID